MLLYSRTLFGNYNDGDGRWEEYTFLCKKQFTCILSYANLIHLGDLRILTAGQIQLPLSHTYTKHIQFRGA